MATVAVLFDGAYYTLTLTTADGCIGVKKIVIHDDLIVDSQDKEDAHYNLPQSSMLGIHH